MVYRAEQAAGATAVLRQWEEKCIFGNRKKVSKGLMIEARGQVHPASCMHACACAQPLPLLLLLPLMLILLVAGWS